MKFKVGDVVELAIDVNEFKRMANDNNCTERYIDLIASGHSVVVYKLYDREPQANHHIKFKKVGWGESNWFRSEWFKPVNNELHQLQLDSQRL